MAISAVAALSGCGGGAADGTDDLRRMVVHLLRGEHVGAAARRVAEDRDPIRAAVEELLAGPSAAEADAGLGTAIPAGVELLDVEVADGVVTVDLSGRFADGGGSASMFARLAQLVFTVTGFEEARSGVRLRLDGADVETFSSEGIVLDGPQTRADYEEQSPAILVETPAVGDAVGPPLRVAGTANVFEATVLWELAADGRRLAGGFATATCGTGCRGAFAVEASFDPGEATAGMLTVWEPSAMDGSRTKVVEIPLRLAAG